MSLIKNELYNIDTGTWIQGQLDGGNTVTYKDYVEYVLSQLQSLDDFFLQCRYTELTYSGNVYPAIMLPFANGTTAPSDGTGFAYGPRATKTSNITSATATNASLTWCCSSANAGGVSVQPQYSAPNAVQYVGSTVSSGTTSNRPTYLAVKLEVYDNFYGITFYNANSEVAWCNLKVLILPSLNMVTNETSYMLLQLNSATSASTDYVSISGANVGENTVSSSVVGVNQGMYDASNIIKLLPVVKGDYVAKNCYFLSKSATTLLDNDSTLNNTSVQKSNAVGDRYFNLNSKDYSIVYSQENFSSSAIILCMQEEDE